MMSDGVGTEIRQTTLNLWPTALVHASALLMLLDSEGGDRSKLANVEQDYLVNYMADNCNNTVGPRLLSQSDDHENFTAIFYCSSLGQSDGHIIDEVLSGDVNPSGKLVHKVAKNDSDYESNFRISESSEANLIDGNFIDYKYFDVQNKSFGYKCSLGLSYTTSGYASNIIIAADTGKLSNTYASGALAVGGREDTWDIIATVSTTITNTGRIAGAEDVQLYMGSSLSAADEPVEQLRDSGRPWSSSVRPRRSNSYFAGGI